MKCKDCTVFGCQYRTTDAEKDCYYEQWTAKEPFDWKFFRNQAAKDILCAIINRESSFTRNGEVVVSHQDFIEIAIEDADALIKQLKEREEKWKQAN